MSKIIVKINNKGNINKILKDLKNITGLGISEIKKNIENHKEFVAYKLFYNDHNEIAEKLIKLINILSSQEMHYNIYELDTSEQLNIENADLYEIDAQTLLNILDEFDREVERQI